MGRCRFAPRFREPVRLAPLPDPVAPSPERPSPRGDRIPRRVSRFAWPRLDPLPSLALLAALMAEGALKGFVNSVPGPERGWVIVLYVSGWSSAWLSYPVAKVFVASAPPTPVRWARFAVHHSMGYALCACLCLLASRALRAVATRAFEITLPAPTWLADYLAGVHLHTTFYAGLVFALSAATIAGERDRLAVRAAEVDATLSAERVEATASLVAPAELVRTLREVKERLGHDVREAERLTQGLGDRLRAALSTREGT